MPPKKLRLCVNYDKIYCEKLGNPSCLPNSFEKETTMKKLLVIALAVVLALSVVSFAACSGKEWEGEYSYKSAYGEDLYGCKVKVTIQGDVITKVVVQEDTADYHNLSAGWTDNYQESGHDTPGKTNWLKYGQAMADSFVGLTTKEVLGMKVFVSKYAYEAYDKTPAGQPVTNGSVETIKYIPEQLAVVMGGHGEIEKGAGATQSSARLVLAVQDAILKSQGKDANPNLVEIDLGRVFTGECKYESAWEKGSYYGAKVDVSVANGKIVDVRLYSDEETGWTRTTKTWTANEGNPDATPPVDYQLGYEAAEAAYQGWFSQIFIGKTVEEVMAYEASATQDAQTVGTASVNLVGATQSSARIICAVKDALSKIAD